MLFTVGVAASSVKFCEEWVGCKVFCLPVEPGGPLQLSSTGLHFKIESLIEVNAVGCIFPYYDDMNL